MKIFDKNYLSIEKCVLERQNLFLIFIIMQITILQRHKIDKLTICFY